MEAFDEIIGIIKSTTGASRRMAIVILLLGAPVIMSIMAVVLFPRLITFIVLIVMQKMGVPDEEIKNIFLGDEKG